MSQEKYIGMDVHQATISVAVTRLARVTFTSFDGIKQGVTAGSVRN